MEKMCKKKVVCDKIMVIKIIEKGFVIVYIGKGKGKLIVGFGMVFCFFGYGYKVGVV